MNLRQIEIFHAVMQTGSLNQAAKLLNVSQPTLSQSLKHAEDQLGYLLFSRVKGRLVPTREGMILFEHAQGVMDHLARFNQISDNLQKHTDTRITIGAVPALHFFGLPQATHDLADSFPNLNMALRTIHFEEAAEALTRKKIDAAILFCPVSFGTVFQVETVAKAHFEILTREELPPDARDITRICSRPDYVSISSSGPLGALLDAHLAENGVSVSSRLSTETYYSSAVMAQRVAIVDSFTAQAFSTTGLNSYPVENLESYDVGIVYSKETEKGEIIRFLADRLRRHLSG